MCLPKIYLDELKFHGFEEHFKANISFCYFPQIYFYQEAVKYLHPKERNYYETLKFEKRIKSYLLGRYAAKMAVGAFTGEEQLDRILIQQGVFSQPIVTCLSQQNIQVSITHSDDFGAAVAFSEAYPIGIDLERISLNKTDILENQITETEKELIGQLMKTKLYSYEALLTLFWTAREALSKVLKTGLLTPFTIYEIGKLEIKSGYIVSYFKNFAQYHNISFQLDHYMCSITCPKKTKLGINISALKEKLGLTLTEDNIHYRMVQ